MKIIEAMKEIVRLHEKAADLRAKVAQYCADLDYETPTYPDQEAQVREWIQSHTDTVQRIARLREAIAVTNVRTLVTIELGGVAVSKTIFGWIQRRGNGDKKLGLASLDQQMWASLTDRNLREGVAANSSGNTLPVKIRRHFQPQLRDRKVLEYRSEASIIDAKLEVVNAITDLDSQAEPLAA